MNADLSLQVGTPGLGELLLLTPSSVPKACSARPWEHCARPQAGRPVSGLRLLRPRSVREPEASEIRPDPAAFLLALRPHKAELCPQLQDRSPPGPACLPAKDALRIVRPPGMAHRALRLASSCVCSPAQPRWSVCLKTPSPWAPPPPATLQQPRGACLTARSRAQDTAAPLHRWGCSTHPGPRMTEENMTQEDSEPAPGRPAPAKSHQRERFTSRKPRARGRDLPAGTTLWAPGALGADTSAHTRAGRRSSARRSLLSVRPGSPPPRPPGHGGLRRTPRAVCVWSGSALRRGPREAPH